MRTKNGVKVDGEIVQFEPHILFQKLAVAAERTDNIDPETIFKHELTTIPKALAETPELLHEAQKSTLADTLWTAANLDAASIPDNVRYVLDGGALLHRIPWSRGASYESILEIYSKYVATNYGKAVVVFDGYREFTTKDMTHKRCLKGKKGVSITFSLDMNLTVTKEAFLCDPKNKQRFIDFLGTKLTNQGCQVFYDQADADLLIVQKTIESASSMDTVLIGDDTDLLVLLLHHLPQQNKDVFFASDRKKNTKGRVWNIKEVKTKLGTFVCKHMPFLHAFLGCDTTSRLFGIGKGSIIKKFRENKSLQQAAIVFDNPNATQTQIDQAGEAAFVVMYNGKKSDTLDGLRYKKYCDKVATSLTQVDPKVLPPTSASAKFHSRRVFLQTNQWKDPQCDLLPEEWGWVRKDTGLHPILMDMPPAPAELLKIIRCNCTTDCATARCTCKKHGMKCSMACGHCRGSSCSNANAFIEDEDDSDSAED